MTARERLAAVYKDWLAIPENASIGEIRLKCSALSAAITALLADAPGSGEPLTEEEREGLEGLAAICRTQIVDTDKITDLTPDERTEYERMVRVWQVRLNTLDRLTKEAR